MLCFYLKSSQGNWYNYEKNPIIIRTKGYKQSGHKQIK